MAFSNFCDAGKPELPPQRLLRRKEAARYVQETWGIPLSAQTMAKLAVVGGGPLFRKAGRFPLYEIADLDTWANLKLGPKRRSTSDHFDQQQPDWVEPANQQSGQLVQKLVGGHSGAGKT
jgi:hypothetical protein